MKRTVEQEYYSIYMRIGGQPTKGAMLDGIRYARQCSRSGLFIDPVWNPNPGGGNRATRRVAAVINAERAPGERKYNWFLPPPVSWANANRLGLCCSIDNACHLQ